MSPDTHDETPTQSTAISGEAVPDLTRGDLTLPPALFALATQARAQISVQSGVRRALDAAADEFTRLASADGAARDEPRAGLASIAEASGCWRTDAWVAQALLRGVRVSGGGWDTDHGPSCAENAAALRAIPTDDAAMVDLLGPEWPQIVLVGRRLEVVGPMVQVAVLRAAADGPTQAQMATAFVALSETGARTHHARVATELFDAVLGEWPMAGADENYYRECLALALVNADAAGQVGGVSPRGYETAIAPWVGVLGGFGENMTGLAGVLADRRPA